MVVERGQEKHNALHQATKAGTFYPGTFNYLEIASPAADIYLGCLPDTRIIVFIRAPRVGDVKTRLAAGIGAEGACAAYRRMIDHLMPAVRESGYSVELRYTPDDAGDEFSRWSEPGWDLAPQGAGDLGARLVRAFAASEAAGFDRALVIGTDCPYVTASDLREASMALDSHEVVLGPALDGGYWLIGLRRLYPELFQEIPWSSAEVMRVTLQRAQSAHLAVHCLRELGDIDTLADWEAFEKSLAAGGQVTAG